MAWLELEVTKENAWFGFEYTLSLLVYRKEITKVEARETKIGIKP